MKIFTACLGTETNTFSPFVTALSDFNARYLTEEERPNAPVFAVPLVRWRAAAEEQGWAVAESIHAFAMPAGVTLRAAYRELRDQILADLRAAMPVDGVLLSIHGAMVLEGFDLPPAEQEGIDCADGEGDLLAHVRAIVGPDVPIGAELDLHCQLTAKKVANATALVLFKEYPHTDFGERADDLFHIIADAMTGKTRPHMSLHDCHAIGVYHTTREPMRSFVDSLTAMEGTEGVLSVSVGHGFPWADVPDMGTRTLVVMDGLHSPDAAERGAALAKDVGDRLMAIYDEAQPPYLGIDEALDLALELAGEPGEGPVVLADVADNAGGGAPNDATFILRRVLERGIGDIAFANFWDPVVVQLAIAAGEGASFDLRLGGKMGPMSGDPLDVRATVKRIVRDARQTFGKPPIVAKNPIGDLVSLDLGNGVEVGVNSLRTQSTNPDALTQVGVDVPNKAAVVVKSMQHFHAGYGPIAKAVLYVAAPGALIPHFDQLPYRFADRTMRGIKGE